MAKTTGPLFSLDARNAIGKTIVYSYWKGRNYARVRIVPKNPRTDGQAEARCFLGAVGVNNRMIESKAKPGVLMTQILEVTPNDQSWMSYFAKTQIGIEFANILAARIAYGLLGDPAKLLWTAGAESVPVSGFDIGYGVVTPIVAGENLFIAATAGWALGLAIVPKVPSDMIEAEINAFAAAYAAAA